jgi:hypothetical protein
MAVERDVDGHPRAPQAGGKRLGQFLVVLDHQYPHRSMMSGLKLRRGYAARPLPIETVPQPPLPYTSGS